MGSSGRCNTSVRRGGVGVGDGTDSTPREARRRFWRLIAGGAATEDASRALGVACSTGLRWVTEAGGMPPVQLAEPSGRFLSFGEREEIALGRPPAWESARSPGGWAAARRR